jgi:DNA-binding NtrC family response regulator
MSVEPHFDGPQMADDLPPDSVLFGRSAIMQDVRRKLVRISPTYIPLLLQGEIGVGKGVLSRFIHYHSPWVDGPYVRVNCASMSGPAACLDLSAEPQSSFDVAIPKDFGDPGHFAGGTLFLNQVSELKPEVQLQLSHLLADYDWYRIRDLHQGCEKKRIICSSTRNLRREVNLGRFRRELFDRLVVVTVEVPPLRDRLEDLPGIFEYLRGRYTALLGAADTPLPTEVLGRLLAYQWPGNIRELESYVCRYVLLGWEDHIPPAIGGASVFDFGAGGLNRRATGKKKDGGQH